MLRASSCMMVSKRSSRCANAQLTRACGWNTSPAPPRLIATPSGAGTDTAVGHAPIDGTTGTGCDQRGGWYYDKDPATGTPTKITACPVTCSMFQTDLNGHVNVVLGCPTIDVQ